MTTAVPYEKPRDLNGALALYWQEKQWLADAKERERQSREWLADLLCAADDDYVNKTLDLADGWKLKLEVQRVVKVDKSDERYKMLPAQIKTDTDFSATQFNEFCKVTQDIKFNLTGYRKLPQRIKDYLGAAAMEASNYTIKFEPPKENR